MIMFIDIGTSTNANDSNENVYICEQYYHYFIFSLLISIYIFGQFTDDKSEILVIFGTLCNNHIDNTNILLLNN